MVACVTVCFMLWQMPKHFLDRQTHTSRRVTGVWVQASVFCVRWLSSALPFDCFHLSFLVRYELHAQSCPSREGQTRQTDRPDRQGDSLTGGRVDTHTHKYTHSYTHTNTQGIPDNNTTVLSVWLFVFLEFDVQQHQEKRSYIKINWD